MTCLHLQILTKAMIILTVNKPQSFTDLTSIMLNFVSVSLCTPTIHPTTSLPPVIQGGNTWMGKVISGEHFRATITFLSR